NGLPQNSISGLEFDQQGNLWIGTQGGLVRFNGYLFESKTIHVSNPRIAFVKTDIHGNIKILDENLETYRVNDLTSEISNDSSISGDGLLDYILRLQGYTQKPA